MPPDDVELQAVGFERMNATSITLGRDGTVTRDGSL